MAKTRRVSQPPATVPARQGQAEADKAFGKLTRAVTMAGFIALNRTAKARRKKA